MGALAGRYDCRKLIQISQGLIALASVTWGVLFLTGTLLVDVRSSSEDRIS